MVGLIIFVIAIAASLAWLWAGGIDYMKENHPDYKGEDFLNWDNKDYYTTRTSSSTKRKTKQQPNNK